MQFFCYTCRAVIKSQGPGISSSYYECSPRLLLLENRRKIEPKKIPSPLIPRLLVVFTRQLEILVTTLHMHLFFGTDCVFFNLVNSDGVLYFFVCVVLILYVF